MTTNITVLHQILKSNIENNMITYGTSSLVRLLVVQFTSDS